MCPQLNKLGCHFLWCVFTSLLFFFFIIFFLSQKKGDLSITHRNAVLLSEPAINLIVCLHIISLHLRDHEGNILNSRENFIHHSFSLSNNRLNSYVALLTRVIEHAKFTLQTIIVMLDFRAMRISLSILMPINTV